MGLEAASFLDDLVATNPVASDNVSQGDDHVRLLKSVLKASFPSLTAARYLEQARADLVSSTTPALWAAATNYVNITGTTAITGFASGTSGQTKLVRFADALTLTHNASTLNIPGGGNITTAAGDHALIQCDGTTNNTVIGFFKRSGRAIVEPTDPEYTTIELGHATDTTLARDSPGVMSVEGAVQARRDPLINPQTGTTYTLLPADIGKIVTRDSASANTLTIALQASQTYLANHISEVKQLGAGVTTIEAVAGVSLNGVDGGSAVIAAQYNSVSLWRIAEDSWVIDGAHGGVS